MSFIVMLTESLTANFVFSNDGAEKTGLTLFEKPYGSFGIPKKLVLHLPSEFLS